MTLLCPWWVFHCLQPVQRFFLWSLAICALCDIMCFKPGSRWTFITTKIIWISLLLPRATLHHFGLSTISSLFKHQPLFPKGLSIGAGISHWPYDWRPFDIHYPLNLISWTNLSRTIPKTNADQKLRSIQGPVINQVKSLLVKYLAYGVKRPAARSETAKMRLQGQQHFY